jgi:hypothetical protein
MSVVEEGVSIQLGRLAAAIPVLAFLFALIHEIGFGWGLGGDILQYYSPADFLAIAIQFLLFSAIPISFPIVAEYFRRDVEFDGNFSKNSQRFIAALILLGQPAAFYILYILVGIPQETGGIGFVLLLAILWVFASRVKWFARSTGNPILFPIFLLEFFALLMLLDGMIEGRNIHAGLISELPEVRILTPPSVDAPFRLVRLLSSGAVVVDSKSQELFLVQVDGITITSNMSKATHQGLICKYLGICDIR